MMVPAGEHICTDRHQNSRPELFVELLIKLLVHDERSRSVNFSCKPSERHSHENVTNFQITYRGAQLRWFSCATKQLSDFTLCNQVLLFSKSVLSHYLGHMLSVLHPLKRLLYLPCSNSFATKVNPMEA